MWLMLQQDHPDDYVIATGRTHSVRRFCKLVFDCVGLNYQDYVVQVDRFTRPAEVDLLIGDAIVLQTKIWTHKGGGWGLRGGWPLPLPLPFPILFLKDYSKAGRQLGWQPETSFESLVRMMVEADLQRIQTQAPDTARVDSFGSLLERSA